MEQALQVFGSLLVLVAFAAAQRGTLALESSAYLGINLVGSTILAVDAASHFQPGFLLLEGSWALISAWGLIAKRVL